MWFGDGGTGPKNVGDKTGKKCDVNQGGSAKSRGEKAAGKFDVLKQC